MNLWDDVIAEDFSEDDPMSALIGAVGLKTAIDLVQAFSGATFYFPKAESVVRKARNRRIYKEFTGFNHLELACKYNLTTRYIQDLVKDQTKDQRSIKTKPLKKEIVETQLNLFANFKDG